MVKFLYQGGAKQHLVWLGDETMVRFLYKGGA
jgi:hypothetical protein